MVDYYYKSFYMLFKISGIAVDFTKKKNVNVRVSTSPEGLAVQVFWVFFFYWMTLRFLRPALKVALLISRILK